MKCRTRALGFLVAVLAVAVAAQAADYAGTFTGPQVSLTLAASPGGYAGTLRVRDASYPVTAQEQGGQLAGTFTVQSTPFPFDAALAGDDLTLHSGAKSFALHRAAAAAQNPLAALTPDAQPTAPAQAPDPADGATGPTGDAALAALRDLGPAHADPNRDWLLLVYLNGDNSLAEDALFNLKQMERGLPESGVDVVVLWDCPRERFADGVVRHPTLRHVRRSTQDAPGTLDSEVLKDLGQLDMADPKLMSAFIEGAVKAYPAAHHAIFTWDHGGGWASLNNDDYAPGKPDHRDAMDLVKLRAGLVDGMRAAGLPRWDLIGFDMCLMCQLETAAQVHDLADVMVASETLVPGKGMPYTAVMEAFGSGTVGARGIGKKIVIEFDKFHKEDSQRSTTLAALDLTDFDDVNAKLNAVCDKLIPTMATAWSSLARSYFYAEQYSTARDDFQNGRHALESVDLLDALKKCRAAMPAFPAGAEYAAFVAAMDRFVIVDANSQRRRFSNGVAIYAPVVGSAYDPAYGRLEFYRVSHWPRLLLSLYPEQAKHAAPPTIRNFALVDATGKPAAALHPLSNMATAFEVDGTNLTWVRHVMAVRDAEAGGARVLSKDFVVDPAYVAKALNGIEKYGQDADVIMPQMVEGPNKLSEPQLGYQFLMTNGTATVSVLIDNSDLSDPLHFTVPVEVQDPKLGDKPVRGLLGGDGINLAVESCVVQLPQANGHAVFQEFRPSEATRFLPLFEVYLDDGSTKLVTEGSIDWGKAGLTFTMDADKTGDYEEILVAETMSGATTTARFRYRAESDEAGLAQMKQTWRAFKPAMMVGTWEWCRATNPPQPTGTTMTLEATKDPTTYAAVIEATDKAGQKTQTSAMLFFDMNDQPVFRLLMRNDVRQVGGLLGPMWWVPAKDGVNQVMAYPLALGQPLVWRQTGGGGGNGNGNGNGPTPAPQVPDGWIAFTDSTKTLSLSTPPDFVGSPAATAAGKAVFDGFETIVVEPSSSTTVAVIRFDGSTDPDEVAKTIVAKNADAGTGVRLGTPTQTTINGAAVSVYAGNAVSNVGITNTLALYLVKTPRGYTAVSLAWYPPADAVMRPIFSKILGTIKVQP